MVYSHRIQSKNSWYNSIHIEYNCLKLMGITVYSSVFTDRIQKYKLMVSQCIDIEYKRINS
ncbi:hypothetical protein OUZ56_033475 [Daphnia magna]|uniref:Uncharacterized protein n=1 Tax=Daphnia magna TaxID=35525 RepID=A0ABR0BAR2_9CRUS|nr:hypothetical protein OUZ56_033475 [Daphnia magna]